MKLTFTKKRIFNKKFDETMSEFLPVGWKTLDEGDHWAVIPPSGSIGVDIFDCIKTIAIKNSNGCEVIFEELQKIEDAKIHDYILKSMGKTDFVHTSFEKFGFNAKLYASKTMLYAKPILQIGKEDIEGFVELMSGYSIKRVVIYKKNLIPFFTIMALKKFSYHFLSLSDDETFDPSNNAFWGAIPNPNDFASYVDSFLILTPLNFGLSFDRLASGFILLPEKSFVLPYEANAGFADLMLSSPTGIAGGGRFQVFGESGLNASTGSKYVEILLNVNNRFISWLLHPTTSSKDEKIDHAFALQLLATVHGIFSSFHMTAKSNDPNERTIHVFMAFDRLANLNVNYAFLKGFLKDEKKNMQKEAQLFSMFFEEEVFLWVLDLVKLNLGDKYIATLLCKSAKTSYFDLKSSTAHIAKPEKIIRTFRNMAHGAFLKNKGFLNSFSAGEARISPSLPVILYSYMLAFVLVPETLLEGLSKRVSENR